MEVIYGDPDSNPDAFELIMATEGVVLRWSSANQWTVPVADVPDTVWPQLQLAGGLTLDGKPLPATKPA